MTPNTPSPTITYPWRPAERAGLPAIHALLVAAGALGLYERLGFVTFQRRIAYGRDLPAPDGQP